jgi:hypothetical protein
MKRVQKMLKWCGYIAVVAVLSRGARQSRADDRECILWPIYNYGNSILYYGELHSTHDCENTQAEYKILSGDVAYPCDCADDDGSISPDCCGQPKGDGRKDARGSGATFDGLRYKFNRNTDFAEQPNAKWVPDNQNSFAEILSSGDHKYRHVMVTTPSADIPAILYRFEVSIKRSNSPSANKPGSVRTFYVAFQCDGSGGEPAACQTPLDGSHAFAGTYTHNGHDFPLLLLTAK